MTPGPMVGRAARLAELTRAWAAVADGPAARTVVITGAAGVGKSMLVASALAAFAPRPRLVLAGTARIHSPAPYDWLAAVLAGRDTAGLPVPEPALAWLTQHPDAPRERYAPGALLRLAVRAVRALAGAGPAVLVVEDLHALDPASLNLVGELAAAADLAALLLVTSRPPAGAVSPALVARTLARLSGTPGSIRQHLGPLAPAEVRALLARAYGGADVPAELAAEVCERTGGNPYWISELVAAAGTDDPLALARVPLPGHLGLDGGPDGGPDGGLDGGPDGGLGGGPAGAAAVPGGAARPPGDLTAREVEVLHFLAAGMSNKQIARSLGISIRTVTVHVSNLLRKTRSASRTEAAMWAVHRQFGRSPDHHRSVTRA